MYHATPRSNADSIEEHGIAVKDNSRGLSNKHIQSAVFTSEDIETIDSYGDVIFAINTPAMKLKGYTPHVSKEPDCQRVEIFNAINSKYWKIDVELDVERGMDSTTWIVYDSIPVEYLEMVEL